MSSVNFEIKQEDIIRLQEAMVRFGNESENAINDYLMGIGANIGVRSIISLLPTSGRTWKGKGKSAKSGNPFQSDFVNLGFSIRSKKKYNYLYFPDQAAGTSLGNSPLEFMDRGLDKVYNNIVDGLLKSLQIKIEEEL